MVRSRSDRMASASGCVIEVVMFRGRGGLIDDGGRMEIEASSAGSVR